MTPPAILRYNASSVPILQMSISSDTMSESSLYDYGYNFIRTQMATVQGASFPLPYGGRSRQIMVDIDLKALYAQGLSANDVVNAVNAQSLIIPSGIAKIGRVCLRPLLRAVENAVDFDDLFVDAINRQKRKAGEHKLASAWLAAWAATPWKLCEGAHAFVDSQRGAAGGLRAVVLLGVIADVCEVAGGGFRPSDTHQPRYRLLINLPTSSWSMSSPRSAAATPFSTSRRNHSS
jgi:multidrug efflux pump subunit AcrB